MIVHITPLLGGTVAIFSIGIGECSVRKYELHCRQTSAMRRKPIFPISLLELETYSTRRLLGRLRRLRECEESLVLSDRNTIDETGCIEFKQSPEWQMAFRDVKNVLSRREHVQFNRL